jgi:hypothetical protein
MVTLDEIDSEFRRMLAVRGVYKKLCRSNDPVKLRRMYYHVKSVRSAMKIGKVVTYDFKKKWLLLSGWRPGSEQLFTRADVVDILSIAIKMNKQSRAMGGAFVLEQVLKNKAP